MLNAIRHSLRSSAVWRASQPYCCSDRSRLNGDTVLGHGHVWIRSADKPEQLAPKMATPWKAPGSCSIVRASPAHPRATRQVAVATTPGQISPSAAIVSSNGTPSPGSG